MKFHLLLALVLAVGACNREAEEAADKKKGEAAAEDHEQPGVVKIEAEAAMHGGIKVATVEAQRLSGGMDVSAEVQLSPDALAHITTLVAGQVSRVKAALGDHVKAGQVLVELRSADLGEARSSLAQARANLDVAKTSYARQDELQAAGIGAKREFLEALAARQRAEAEYAAAEQRVGVFGGSAGGGSTQTLRSPIDGEIIERHASVGQVSTPEQDLFVVADLRRVWVVGHVYEQDVAVARKGASAVLTLQAYPGRSWETKLDYVAPTLDEQTRTVLVRAELDNADRTLRPGLYGTLSISTTEGNDPIPVVPEAAVQRVKDRDIVFIPTEAEGEFRATSVVVSARRRGVAEIRSGLKAGDKCVVAGAFILKSELLKDEMAGEE